MPKYNNSSFLLRYKILASVLAAFMVCVVLGRVVQLKTVKRDYWERVADREKRDSVPVKPMRGNILSCDGRLLASSLPDFKIFMDFQALTEAGNDSLWQDKLDSICDGLHAIFPEKTAQQFRAELDTGRTRRSRHWPVWKRRIDYNTYSEVKQLPVFRLAAYKSGFHAEETNARQRPYGSLAGRTVGEMYGAKDTAKCGLELSCDSILRGTPGMVKRRKVLSRFLNIEDIAPVDGADIVTTIDIDMQDLAERALRDELMLPEVNGNVGVAIVMEVQTGDVKAIVNLEKCADGQYREVRNHAVSDLLEPGSVFKTASFMVTLDDGMCDTTKMVDTGGGVWPMYGRQMRDHNWHRGGYGWMRLPHALEVSSNIGVSRIVDEYYHDCPEKFVEGIYRTGLADDLHVPIAGASPAKIRMPQKDKRGRQYLNWAKTSLPWMSIGYETQIPPISTLTFYNAIANGGRMMRPRFVKQVMKNGAVVREFEPVVQRPQICKEKTVRLIQTILEHVVSQGLGKKAGSPSFKVAGKTGTAQMSKGAAGYKSGQVDYLLSFAGYFPADAPRYSCIVCIQKSGLPASGGGMSGVVFHHIAEGIMAQSLKLGVDDARDESSVAVPDVKGGNITYAAGVLDRLGINTLLHDNIAAAKAPLWGAAERKQQGVALAKTTGTPQRLMPDVRGLGARDAVYLIERRGVRTTINGRGAVHSQSLAPGTEIKRGMVCQLVLK